MNILVVEDGFEYSELMGRFLGSRFSFQRVGDGYAALEILASQTWNVVLLDLCFDRISTDRLLGDVAELADQFNGRLDQCKRYVERNQGIFILAAMREKGFETAVLISHDFSRESARWERLKTRYGPIQFVSDNAGPEEISEMLMDLGKAQ